MVMFWGIRIRWKCKKWGSCSIFIRTLCVTWLEATCSASWEQVRSEKSSLAWISCRTLPAQRQHIHITLLWDMVPLHQLYLLLLSFSQSLVDSVPWFLCSRCHFHVISARRAHSEATWGSVDDPIRWWSELWHALALGWQGPTGDSGFSSGTLSDLTRSEEAE